MVNSISGGHNPVALHTPTIHGNTRVYYFHLVTRELLHVYCAWLRNICSNKYKFAKISACVYYFFFFFILLNPVQKRLFLDKGSTRTMFLEYIPNIGSVFKSVTVKF